MRSAKDFFRPLAVGAPEPLREIPARPSRAIHFFDPSNEKMAAKVPAMVGTVDVLLGNLEDAVKADNKEAARAGLVKIARETADLGGHSGPTQLWTRINALDSPWALDDLTTLVTEIGDKLDVVMVPKVQGAEDISYVDRLLAQLEAKAGLERPILVHAILETARGVANVEEICGASPRMQGLSLGPADLAADRRMKTTRVGGGHPGYLVRQDPGNDLRRDRVANRKTYQQDLWHYTIARMVDACAMHGIYPYYGPFGDIADVIACEDQFRNAFLLGCVGTWTLHPTQIEIANRVFSPSARRRPPRPPRGRRHGRRHRSGDARREDGGRRLPQAVPGDGRARRAAGRDRPGAEEAVRRHRRRGRPVSEEFRARRSVLYMPSSNERALEKAKTIPCDGLIFDLEDAVAPDAKTAARDAACAAAASGEYGARELTIRVNGADTEWHADDLAAACAAGPDAVVVPKVNTADAVLELVDAMARHGAPEQTMLWAMVETPYAMLHAEEIAAASDRLTVLVMGTNDLAKELYAEHVPGRHPLLPGLGLALLAARATGKAILDGVYNDVKDTDGFLAECRQGREMGFDGKTLIHPGQVDGANEAFAPSEKAVDDARGILQAWEDGAGSGVVTYNGRMIENLHVESARRTLAIHDAIAARA